MGEQQLGRYTTDDQMTYRLNRAATCRRQPQGATLPDEAAEIGCPCTAQCSARTHTHTVRWGRAAHRACTGHARATRAPGSMVHSTCTTRRPGQGRAAHRARRCGPSCRSTCGCRCSRWRTGSGWAQSPGRSAGTTPGCSARGWRCARPTAGELAGALHGHTGRSHLSDQPGWSGVWVQAVSC